MSDLLSTFPATTPRFSASSYKDIITKVREFYRKSSPYGCSQNIKAEVRDIDKAVEANRLREKRVDEYAQNELKKLNLSINKSQLGKSHTIPAESARSASKAIKFSITKPKTADIQYKRRMSDSGHNDPSVRAASAAYEKRIRIITRPNPLKSNRIASLDAIMKSCDELKPQLKPDLELIHCHENEFLNSANDVKEFIDDMEDCMKLADNETKMKKLMNECKNSRKINRVLGVEPGIKDEMLIVTRRLIQLGGYKVWRHNHAEFMASAEKIINSIPKNRS